jgi:homoserine kinase
LRLGILAGLNALAGEPLDRDQLFDLCTETEGHPDNAGPAAVGGFFVGAAGQSFSFPIDDRLRFVLLIPQNEVLTDPSRGALPVSIPHTDAVRNTANACAIVAAFASRQYGQLRGAFQDYLHQAYRAHLVPGLMEVIGAGTAAGALGGWLSGSGSTMACLTDQPALAGTIAAAMVEAHASCRPDSEAPAVMEIVAANNSGVTWKSVD